MDTSRENSIEVQNNLTFKTHLPSGPLYKDICKQYALLSFKNKEDLIGIYSLCESHTPTYRIKAGYRFEKLLETEKTTGDKCTRTINRDYVNFNCKNSVEFEVKNMLNKVAEMPKEWTIVQITTKFNINEVVQSDFSKLYTDALHITIFNCGQSSMKPFCKSVGIPKDSTGLPMELCSEMYSLLAENKTVLSVSFPDGQSKMTMKQRMNYNEQRGLFNNRLKNIIKQMESCWLREWRCLFIGKFVNETNFKNICKEIDLKIQNRGYNYTEECKYLLHKIIASSEYLSRFELLQAVTNCLLDDKELMIEIYKDILKMSNKLKVQSMKRHPVVLIVDEKVDCFPWEKIDVLVNHPATRMPCLDFTYGLFKEHESSIVDGVKHVHATNGSYIVNPSRDLKKMEERLVEFFRYWLPDWTGIVGRSPSSDEFSENVSTTDIFVYNGHGSGTQYLAANKIQQIRVSSVVLLFGCGSIRMSRSGPLVEMYDVFQNYIIACSPCVVGMLWEVTDFDTDLLSTALLSTWISSKVKETHWRDFEKSTCWNHGTLQIKKVNELTKNEPVWEPELLRAINIANKESVHFLTKCAIVSRGLPIKIIQ